MQKNKNELKQNNNILIQNKNLNKELKLFKILFRTRQNNQ